MGGFVRSEEKQMIPRSVDNHRSEEKQMIPRTEDKDDKMDEFDMFTHFLSVFQRYQGTIVMVKGPPVLLTPERLFAIYPVWKDWRIKEDTRMLDESVLPAVYRFLRDHLVFLWKVFGKPFVNWILSLAPYIHLRL
jgi:hypothetical protein